MLDRRGERRPRGLAGGALLIAAAALASSRPAGATTLLRSQELPALVEESRRAVLADVLSVRRGYDERGLHATFITLRVEEPLYGEGVPRRGGRLTLKLYGAPDPMADGSRLFIDGTPRYRPGDRLLLLLLPESPWGFTNTAGLSQGAFRIATDPRGIPTARSVAGNRGVIGEQGLGSWVDRREIEPHEADHAGPTGGPVPYSLLKKAVLSLWAATGREGDRPGPAAEARRP